MPHIEVTASMTRSEVRHAHHVLADASGAPVTLHLRGPFHSSAPSQYAAWMQLILTWGQDTTSRRLTLDDLTFTRFRAADDLSDIELLAVFLAEVVVHDETDITAGVAPSARAALESRVRFTHHHGDGGDGSTSLLLAAHTFKNRTSPDLHALWEGKPAIEETARTLYHDLWPLPRAGDVLRRPFTEVGEKALPAENPTHLRRTAPAGMSPIVTVGERAPRARGYAAALATKHRVQDKPIHDEVGEILFELVQNTEWHAKRAGGRTGANCRAITFREYTIHGDALDDIREFDPAFAAYARHAIERGADGDQSGVNEVTLGSATIVDSGVGLARSAALSVAEEHLLGPSTEVAYLIRALTKNLKRGRRLSLGNIGLARVQQSLTNLGGFMSIRTGTVELRRDFIGKPFEPTSNSLQKPPPALILDWMPDDESDFVIGPRLGTAVTVVYPVEYRAGA